MKKIFWDNPYQYELDTKVIEVNGNQLLLREYKPMINIDNQNSVQVLSKAKV